MAQCDAVTHVHHCSLTVQPAGSDQAFSIAKLLISEGLAWTKFQASATRKPPVGRSIAELVGEVYNPSSQQQSLLAEVDGEGEGHYEEEDVIVLDTVGGPYFWAYVGAGSVSMVDSVTDLLQKELPSMTTFTPTVGNLVAVRDEEPSPGLPGMMRAKVLVVKRVEVTVFAVDFGVMRTVKVNSVFPLSGSALCLVHLDGLAKLCCLAGEGCVYVCMIWFAVSEPGIRCGNEDCCRNENPKSWRNCFPWGGGWRGGGRGQVDKRTFFYEN